MKAPKTADAHCPEWSGVGHYEVVVVIVAVFDIFTYRLTFIHYWQRFQRTASVRKVKFYLWVYAQRIIAMSSELDRRLCCGVTRTV